MPFEDIIVVLRDVSEVAKLIYFGLGGFDPPCMNVPTLHAASAWFNSILKS